MEHLVQTFSPDQLAYDDMVGMHRLRYEVFAERLGWDVGTENGMERDQFDDIAQVAFMLAKSPEGLVDACWRILPTTGPYMLRDVFPELLHGQQAPMSDDCWELSRFAVATNRTATGNASFGPISRALMAESAAFAKDRGINRYVTVTTPIMERMLKHQGLHIHRIGPPIRIGVAAAVACVIEVDDITLKAVGMA
ncbi:MAG: acyl-homoserine-lactone synthase [Pseudomonadota bacterium]